MVFDPVSYSDWFSPKNIPAEIPLPERTAMALANKPVQPNCSADEMVDGEPDYTAEETVVEEGQS